MQLFLLIFAASIILVAFIAPLLLPAQPFSLLLFVIDLLSLAVIVGALFLVHAGYVRVAAAATIFFLFSAVTYAKVRLQRMYSS